MSLEVLQTRKQPVATMALESLRLYHNVLERVTGRHIIMKIVEADQRAKNKALDVLDHTREAAMLALVRFLVDRQMAVLANAPLQYHNN